MMRHIAKTIAIIILNPAMWIVIAGAVGIGYLHLGGCRQERFVERATRLQLVGKTRQDVINAFGRPDATYVFTNDHGITRTLGYKPGSSLDLGCTFYLDTNDVVTKFWDGNSD